MNGVEVWELVGEREGIVFMYLGMGALDPGKCGECGGWGAKAGHYGQIPGVRAHVWMVAAG